MSRNQIVFWIGLILVTVTLSGFPSAWKFWTYIIAGLGLISLSLRNSIVRGLRERHFHLHRPGNGNENNTNMNG